MRIQVMGTDILEYLIEIGGVKGVRPTGVYPVVDGVAPLSLASSRDVTWAKYGGTGAALIHVGVLLVPMQKENPLLCDGVTIYCEKPRAALGHVIHRFFSHLIEASDPIVGTFCRIAVTAVLGCPGQGPEITLDGGYQHFPHVGGLIVEEDVEIGEFATICRGVLGNTIIQEGAILGHHVNVGHECLIGRRARLAPHCTIGGGATIEGHAVLWQGVCVADKVRIGKGSVVGMGSVVLKDIPEGEVWAGNPARKIRDRAKDDPRGLGSGRL